MHLASIFMPSRALSETLREPKPVASGSGKGGMVTGFEEVSRRMRTFTAHYSTNAAGAWRRVLESVVESRGAGANREGPAVAAAGAGREEAKGAESQQRPCSVQRRVVWNGERAFVKSTHVSWSRCVLESPAD